MKRVSIYFIIGLLFLVLSLRAQEQKQEPKQEQEQLQEQENPFNSFMGMKWNTDAAQFKSNFRYKDRMDEWAGDHIGGFYLTNFKLGDLIVEDIRFEFKPDSQYFQFRKDNYAQFKLKYVMMTINPKQFEPLYDILKVKYGEPKENKESEIQNRMGAKFIQEKAYWEHGDRAILLQRYDDKLDIGKAFFSPVEKVDAKEKEAKDKAAADKL